jgi:oxygen-dependent protoporphyrinogen oxidase
MADPRHVAIIGGGTSGLACAFRLRQLGVPVTLLEATGRFGGLVGTVEKDGFLFESGPQSFQGTDKILELIRDVGIEGELCRADPRAPRYVLRQGRLLKIPMSPPAVLTTSLLGVSSRWKIVSEPFRRTKPPSEEESIAQFVRRKFGHEILEYLVAPFVSGVYAGDPEKLSLRAAFPTLEEWEREYGSVLRGAMKSRSSNGASTGAPPLCAFRRGLSTLAQAMAARLGESAQVGARVEALNRAEADGRTRYRVRVTRDGRQETLDAQAVVIASPAYAASPLVRPISPALAQALSGIAHAPVAVVASGYFARQIGRSVDGFGFLVPRVEKVRTLGTVWNSSLFPERAREGSVAMTSFIGGATNPEIASQSEQEIATAVQDDNAKILEIAGPPVTASVWKHAKALPQYNLGHGHIVREIRDGERAIPGLFFAGNYLQGPALGKCVEQAYETAEAVRAYLEGGAARSA